MKVLVLLTVAFLTLPTLPALATTIVVDQGGTGDHLTIQEGVNAAIVDDIVSVVPGTYTGPNNRDIDFGGRNILLISQGDWDDTIIDCENLGRGFYFHTDEDSTATVEGFTITNGEADRGGGAYCYNGASPTFTSCRFLDNHASERGGGAACKTSSNARFLQCQFIDNACDSFGGGIHCQSSGGRMENCTLQGNTSALQGGGGAMCYLSTMRFAGSTFSGNIASSGQGGGLYAQESALTVTNCSFEENEAGLSGGAISFWNLPSTVSNCVFVGNMAGTYAAGISCRQDADATISNCTFALNSCPMHAAGVSCYDASPTIEKTIIAFSTEGSAVSCYSGTETPSITNCCIFGNAGGDDLCGSFSGNISMLPLFCDVPGLDFSLCANSPCLPGAAENPCGELIGAYASGCPNCESPVQHTSWGRIKGIYR